MVKNNGMEIKRNSRLRAWTEIREENLAWNLECLREMLPPGSQIMAVVKANGYGHGAVETSRILEKCGTEAFAVATLTEGIELRNGGIQGKILILGYTPPENWKELAEYGLIQTIVDRAYGLELNRRAGVRLPVHLKVDTGMNRLGISWQDREGILEMFCLSRLQVEGIFSHLCAADGTGAEDQEYTRLQISRFRQTEEWVRSLGYRQICSHLQSSYGIIHYPEAGGNYARAGIALYGVLSSPDEELKKRLGIRPVLSLRARVASVKEICPGDFVGYGRSYQAEKRMRIAGLTIGYADGLPRSLKGGSVLIRGKRCRIIGRICMDQCTVEAEAVPDIMAGDVATVIGSDGAEQITAEEVAEQSGTITNELLSRLGSRLTGAAEQRIPISLSCFKVSVL